MKVDANEQSAKTERTQYAHGSSDKPQWKERPKD